MASSSSVSGTPAKRSSPARGGRDAGLFQGSPKASSGRVASRGRSAATSRSSASSRYRLLRRPKSESRSRAAPSRLREIDGHEAVLAQEAERGDPRAHHVGSEVLREGGRRGRSPGQPLEEREARRLRMTREQDMMPALGASLGRPVGGEHHAIRVGLDHPLQPVPRDTGLEHTDGTREFGEAQHARPTSDTAGSSASRAGPARCGGSAPRSCRRARPRGRRCDARSGSSRRSRRALT